MVWTLNKTSSMKKGNSILIEGLPGVGNVGKIAVEYLIGALNAKKVYEINSEDLPHYAFVNEDNLIELPTVEIYSAKINGKNIMLLSGDIQPQSESSCYSFCNNILDTFEKSKGEEIITLGGIAMKDLSNNPEIYLTANNKNMLKKYKTNERSGRELHEFIGPIVGVTGILPGLARKRNIPAVTMLIETFENPNHVGITEAKKIIKHLNKKLNLKLKEKIIEKDLNIEGVLSPSKKELKKEPKKNSKEDRENKKRFSYIG
tara:strand:- start:9125 stop:9904 length:780 start_codon:yes stop_codon:yes gene_type:complete